MKKCTKCKIEKELICFSKDTSKRDGLRSSCRSCQKTLASQYYSFNKEEINKQHNEYYENNKKQRSIYKKEYYKNNKEKVKQYYEDNKQEKIVYFRQYHRKRRKEDSKFRITCSLRARFWKWLNGFKKDKRTFEYINCSKEELMVHLESLFQPDMTWENYGEWHIDHIRPLSSFDPTSEVDMHLAWRKENLQPLWAVDNIRKGNKQ